MTSMVADAIEFGLTVLASGVTAWLVSRRVTRTAAVVTDPDPKTQPTVDVDDGLSDAVYDWAERHDVPEAAPLLLNKLRLGRQLQQRRRSR